MNRTDRAGAEQPSGNGHSASRPNWRIPSSYDAAHEAENAKAAEQYYNECNHETFLNTQTDKKPDLLTTKKIDEIAGQFHTIKDLSEGAYEPNGWIVPRLIPSDCIVTLQGQAKSGKSTFVLHMIKELTSSGVFLGEKLELTKVVYVTEQNKKSFLSQLESAGISPDVTNLTALTVEGTLGLSGWKALFHACERQLLETSAKMLVIDSWGRFTGITEQEENKTAPVQERITELRKIVTNTGATILILHHVRKSGGMMEAGLGSSALAQQVDVLLSLSGEPAQKDASAKDVSGPQCRMIQSKGRFSDVLNQVQVKWEPDKYQYVLLGAPPKNDTVERLLQLLTTAPDDSMDAEALAIMYKATYGKQLSSRTIENRIPAMRKHPSVQQVEGSGIKGVPARFYRTQ